MPDTGKELAVDLRELLMVARVYLPDVAEAYVSANRHVAGTAETNSYSYGTDQGAVHPYWTMLRDEFQRILATTADNLIDTAAALERVVNAYCATDAEAAAELKRLINEPYYRDRLSQPTYDDVPPPRMPEE